MDLVYSYAVLEHVPERVAVDLTGESRRILKPGGRVYHAIGLHDHYVSASRNISKVNFLQYPEWLWAFFVKNKFSYHNRLREKQFLDIFEAYGAQIEWIKHEIDPADLQALQNMNIDKRFAGMTHEELAVTYSEIILSFPRKEEATRTTPECAALS